VIGGPPRASERAAASGASPGPADVPRWPPGDGPASRAVATHDWAATPLGPIDGWSPALRVSVGAMLASDLPQVLAWGPGLVQLHNDAFAAMLGERHRSVLGRRAGEGWAGSWPGLAARLARVAETGAALVDEDLPEPSGDDGTPAGRRVDCRWAPARDEHGVVRGVLGTLRARRPDDRSDAGADRANDGQLGLAMQSSALGLWEMDPATRLVRVSGSVRGLFGMPEDSDPRRGEPIRLVHPDDRARVDAAIAAALDPGSSGAYHASYRIVRPDGSIRHVDAVGRAEFEVRDGERRAARLVGVIWDVTDRQRLLESLSASEATLRAVLDALPVGVVIADRDGRIVRDNAAHHALWGAPPTGAPPAGRVGRRSDTGERIGEDGWALRRALMDGEVVHGELVEYERLDTGERRWMLNHAAPVRDAQGRIDAAVAVEVDVTGHRQAEAALRQSEERFRLLADTMPQIVWTTRPDGYHDYFNERWYEFTGMPRPHEPGGEYDPTGTGQGWNWKTYLHPDDYEPTLATWTRSLATGEPYHVEYRFKRHDGQYRWFIGRALPLRGDDGGIVRWFGTLTDIDDQKRTAQQRDALIERLREADVAKDEFLAMLAHELRNPLAPIRNAIALLGRESLTAPADRALVMSRRQLAHLVRLVDDLLEVARVSRGKIELRPEPVMLQHVVHSVVDGLAESLEQRRQIIRVRMPERPLRIVADPVRLAQVIDNLLTNASKYTNAGGEIAVRARQDGDAVRIDVRDTGIGIAPEHLPRLFTLFSQVDTAIDRSRGGLGIGLALVRRLVELHGGTVEAHSDGPGRGSTFTVHLPLSGARAAPERTAS